MTIACSTIWPKQMPDHLAGQPTEFIDKIWNCLKFDDTFDLKYNYDDWSSYMDAYFLQQKTSFPFCTRDVLENKVQPDVIGREKMHTLREDPKDRWRAGLDIHFVINNRTKQRFQFAPVVKCVSIQEIDILITSYNEEGIVSGALVYVDRRYLGAYNYYFKLPSYPNIEKLAKNDGFDSVEDFFAWFNKDFTGKIIHWTNLKY